MAPSKNKPADADEAKRPARGAYKLDQDLSDKICAAVRLGNYIETAAAFAGIARSTLYEWMKLGRATPKEGETVEQFELAQPYREFVVQLEQAMASAEVRDVTTIMKASSRNWQAAAWRLERRNPERWGRRDRPEVPEDKVTPTGIVVLPAIRPVTQEQPPEGDRLLDS